MAVTAVEIAPATRLDQPSWVLITVLSASAFMAVLDGTMVGVALRDLAVVFDTELSTVGWATVSYLLAVGVSMPP